MGIFSGSSAAERERAEMQRPETYGMRNGFEQRALSFISPPILDRPLHPGDLGHVGGRSGGRAAAQRRMGVR